MLIKGNPKRLLSRKNLECLKKKTWMGGQIFLRGRGWVWHQNLSVALLFQAQKLPSLLFRPPQAYRVHRPPWSWRHREGLHNTLLRVLDNVQNFVVEQLIGSILMISILLKLLNQLETTKIIFIFKYQDFTNSAQLLRSYYRVSQN